MRKNGELFRDPLAGKVAGVCAGIAQYMGWELWLVRIAVVTGVLLSGSFFLVGYFVLWIILDKKPSDGEEYQSQKKAKRKEFGKGWVNTEDRPVEVKGKVWQAGEPPIQAYKDITVRFNHLESRLRGMESFVTSKEFQLKREISNL